MSLSSEQRIAETLQRIRKGLSAMRLSTAEEPQHYFCPLSYRQQSQTDEKNSTRKSGQRPS